VGRNERCELGQHGEERRWRRSAFAHGGRELAQEQDLGGLAGVVRGLPGPGAFGVGAADGSDHRGAKRMHIDCPAAFEIGKQQIGGSRECRAGIR
jgi:hypothetical protein